MRLRNVRGAREEMLVNPHVILDPAACRGEYKKLFGNENPVRIEVGMGKGQFIMQLAEQNPDVNYIGIEKYSSVLIRAIEKQEQKLLPNLKFIRMDAERLPEVFAPGEIDRIYLNFSDPWPKDRHAKRRLTSSAFLDRYLQIIRPGAEIEFKTDNADLFAFSVESAKEAGWTLLLVTDDLHHSPFLEGNVMTEYETKFAALGNPIHKMVIRKDGN